MLLTHHLALVSHRGIRLWEHNRSLYLLAQPSLQLLLRGLGIHHHRLDGLRLLLVQALLNSLLLVAQMFDFVVEAFAYGVNLLLLRSLHTSALTTELIVKSLERLGPCLFVNAAYDVLGKVQNTVQVAPRDVEQ